MLISVLKYIKIFKDAFKYFYVFLTLKLTF